MHNETQGLPAIVKSFEGTALSLKVRGQGQGKVSHSPLQRFSQHTEY